MHNIKFKAALLYFFLISTGMASEKTNNDILNVSKLLSQLSPYQTKKNNLLSDDIYFNEIIESRKMINGPLTSYKSCNKFKIQSYRHACLLISLGDSYYDNNWKDYLIIADILKESSPQIAKKYIFRDEIVKRLVHEPPLIHHSGRESHFIMSDVNNNYLFDFPPFEADVKINDHYGKFFFDSGATMSVISEDLARRSGVRYLGIDFPVAAFTGNVIRIPLASVKELRIGNDIYQNVIVAIINYNIIGMDIISRFKNIKFSYNEVIINQKHIPKIECEFNIRMLSSFTRGRMLWHFPMIINGKKIYPTVDLGNLYWLTHFVTGSSQKSLSLNSDLVQDIAGGYGDVKVNRVTINLKDKKIGVNENHIVNTVKGDNFYFNEVFGAYMLQDFDIYIDNENRWGCVYDNN